MNDSDALINQLAQEHREQFRERRAILPFGGFLELVKRDPRRMLRNAAEYLTATFEYFGKRDVDGGATRPGLERFKLFDEGTEKNGPIVGGDLVQDEIYKILKTFTRQGYVDKLILLHGPNGSAKTSTVEAIAHGMQRYSHTDEGAVYTFSWIFPVDKEATPIMRGESGPIGFGARQADDRLGESYALLDDSQIASKIRSEFKDNPIYLLPIPQRESWLRQVIAEQENINPEDVELPKHATISGLSKRNQLIMENLLSAYEGDLGKVLRHVQVERFYYSRQYRVGVSTVEPQMHLDAGEKQLTMDKNIANLPTVLHNIRFHEAMGELIEGNRGLIEFSDLLKRPVEAFKYLLTTVEKSSISLPSSTHHLDIVFLATTNEKHLDTFKTVPDFSSFRGRFELVTVPYLLRPSQEERIYQNDMDAFEKTITIAPHALELLSIWAVMTRLKQPDPEIFESQHRALVARLDPRNKVRLYEDQNLRGFKPTEETTLRELRSDIVNESIGLVVYEGRFGASPREIRGILQRAAANPAHRTLSPMAVFDELERIVKDRTVYEFLQFEPRGKYHDAALFIEVIKDEFVEIFESEVLKSMSLVSDEEYDKLLSRYIEHVVAKVKKEKIYNSATETYEAPSEAIMGDIERIINVQGSVERYREGLLSRIAAFRLDHPDESIQVTKIFADILEKIEEHYHGQHRQVVDENYQNMLALDTNDEKKADTNGLERARSTYAELARRFGYDAHSARESLKFMLKHNKTRKK